MGSTVSTVRAFGKVKSLQLHKIRSALHSRKTGDVKSYEDIVRSSHYFAAPPEMVPTAAMSCKSIYAGTKIRGLNTANGTVGKE